MFINDLGRSPATIKANDLNVLCEVALREQDTLRRQKLAPHRCPTAICCAMSSLTFFAFCGAFAQKESSARPPQSH